MDDGFDTPPTPDELGQPAAAEPQATTSGGDHPLPTTVSVKEPDGAVAPVPADSGNQEDPWSTPPTQEETAQAEQPAVNHKTLGFVAANGDLPKDQRAADIIRYSAASGLPANIVAADLEGVKQKVDASGVDWKKLAERQPALAQYLAENPHAIQLVKDDTHNLGMIEWAFGGHPFTAFMDAWHEQGTTALQFLRAEGYPGLDPTIEKRIAEEQASQDANGGPSYGAHNLLTKAVVGTAKFLPYMALDKAARVIGGIAGGVLAAAPAVETGPGAAVTGLGGAAIGQFASSGIFNYAEALGPLSWQLDHLKDENGQKLNPAVANVAAQIGAVGSGALMSGTMGLYTGKASSVANAAIRKALPGVASAIENVASSAVGKWLLNGETREGISKFIGRWGLHTAIGAGMMAANSAVQSASTEAAKSASGMDGKWGNIADAFATGGEQGLKDLWLFSAVPAVQAHMADLGQARASAEATVKFQKAVEAASGSSTLAKSPEAFQQIAQLANPDAKVYVPAERWVSYFQDKKLDPAQMAQAVGVEPEAMTNAVSAGGSLAIPASKFLATLTKDGHAEGLSMDVKTSPELLTPNEFKAKQEAETERLTNDAKTREVELNDGKKAIENFIVNQAKASKLKPADVRSGAKIMADAAATQALRLNVSVQEAARMMNYGELSITGKNGLTPEHAQAMQDFREWMAPSASQKIKARQATLSTENLIRERYIDRNTGHKNEKHLEDFMKLTGGDTSFDFGGGGEGGGEPSKEGLDFISRMRPENRDAAQKFLDYTQGKLDARPKITDDMEKALARFGIVDPKGYSFNEKGRSLARPLVPESRKTGGGQQPDELRRARIEKNDPNAFYYPYKAFYQEGLGGMPEEHEIPSGPFANIGIEGTKFINDNLDHAQGDLLFRAAAKALHEAAPEVSFHKTTADFEVPNGGGVKDQAHLDEILKKANENLPPELKGFTITGAIGETREGAQDAHIKLKKDAEGAGTRAERGFAPQGFKGNVKELSFPTAKVRTEVHPELAKQVSQMTPEEYFNTTYVEPKTGLLTNTGWQALNHDSSHHYALLDLRGLKDANRLYGKEGGDKLIDGFGKILAHYGGSSFDAAHLHGDEYALRHQDPYRLSKFIDTVREKLNDRFDATLPDGERVGVTVDFWHGLAKGSLDAADRNLNERKAGIKAAQGDVPARAASGNEDHGNEGGRQASLEFRGEALGRGVQPQAYPGSRPGEVVSHVEGRPVVFQQEPRVTKTDTPEFKKWFGDSKVVDKDGKPLVVYHGTWQPGFDEFRGASYFSESPDYAAKFSGHDVGENAAIYPAYLSMKNPLDLSDLGEKDIGWRAFDKRLRERGADLPIELKEVLQGLVHGTPWEFMRRLSDLSPGFFKRAGFDGVIQMEERKRAFISFDPQQIKSATGNRGTFDPSDPNILKQEGGENGPRGQILLDVSGSGSPRAFNIQMLAGDKSTFAHEAAHFLSWSLHDLATSDLATEQIKADYDTLLKFAGYESPEARVSELAAKTSTPKEEKISHGFEQYLSEGKAPSSSLARVFSRFKDWLLGIYKGTEGVQAQYRDRYGQELQLSDEVRQVFDRLLAQDEALKQASQAVGGTGELKDAVAGMTPEQASAYRKAIADSRAEADQETAKGGDERQKAMDAQREALRKQTAAELDQKPVYRAWRYLQHGDMPEVESGAVSPEQFKELFTDENGKPFKISRGEFVRDYGEDVAKLMPPGSLKARGGRPVEEVASRLGFASGQEMVEAIRRATPRDRAITQGTQDKMDAAHGPELQRATDAALSGVHNPRDLQAAVMELRGLAKQINPEIERQAHAIDTDALRANIDRLTGEKMVDQLDPTNHARAERRLAIEAAELRGKGEKEAAYDKMEQRLVSKLLFMSERDAKREMDKAREKLASTSETMQAQLGKADPSFRDVHDAIIAAVRLGEAPPPGAKTLDEMLAVAQAAAHDIDFNVSSIRDILQRGPDWDSSLPIERARDVVDAINNIRTVARRSLEVKIAGKVQDRDEFVQRLVKSIMEARPSQTKQGVQRSNEKLATKAHLILQSFDGNLSDIDTLAHIADGGDRNGPMHQLFVDERHAARDVATKLIKQTLEPAMKKWEAMPKDVKALMSQDVDLSDLPLPPGLARFEDNRTRESLYSVFLNWGNEGNRQRLLDGNGWDSRAVEKNLAKLRPEEADFLQTVLDVTDELYTPMADVHEADTGIRPDKVSASPIIINGKEYRGGYFPAKYDFRASRVGQRQLATDIKNVSQIFAEAYQRPAIGKSHAKERADAVRDAPLDLNTSIVASHLSQVIHDISHRGYVKDAASILLDERVRNALEEKLGSERTKQFMPLLQTVANSQVDSVPANLSTLQRVNSWMRNRMALQAVGWSLRSAAGVVVDPLNAVAARLVSPVHLTPALAKTWNPLTFGSVRDAATALSPELQARDIQREGNLRNAFGEMLGEPKGVMDKLRDTAFWFHTVADKRNETAVWTGRYNQSIAEGKEQNIAIRDADDAVRAVTPSHDKADKAAILRSNTGISSLLVFYGYANKIFNLHRRNFDDAYRTLVGDAPTGEKAKDLAKYAGTAAALMVSHGIVSEYLTGRGKEDDEDYAHWLMRKAITSPFNTLPFLGSVVESVVSGKRVSVKSAPAAAFLEDTATRLAKLAKASDGTSAEEKLLNLVEMVAGFATGAPTAAVHRPIDYVKKLHTGEVMSRGPLDVAGGVVYGNSKANPANPLTDLQKAIR